MYEYEDSQYETLVLYTEIRCLSKSKVLTRFFEMKNELLKFFNNEDPTSNFITKLSKSKLCAKLAYLINIFSYLNISLIQVCKVKNITY